jgi:6-phosphofructokinase 1
MKEDKRVALLTSGGDAPGMNAAIRSVVRTGLAKGWRMFGIRHGYQGLIDGDITSLGARDVGGIIERGGTILHSARSIEFESREGQAKAIAGLRERGIDALVVIGGGGSQTGSFAISEAGFPVVGVASTIDNDLRGTDMSIGVDTALNTALDAIDKLRTTAWSHERVFIVEVMGRECGYLALVSGVAGGAEAIVIPEVETDPEAVAEEVRSARRRGKSHAIVVVAEGARYNAEGLARYFEEHHERLGFELRVTRIGHVQRGGSPTVFDRLLATRLGADAVECLARGEHGVLVGMIKGSLAVTPLGDVAGRRRELDRDLLELARILAA